MDRNRYDNSLAQTLYEARILEGWGRELAKSRPRWPVTREDRERLVHEGGNAEMDLAIAEADAATAWFARATPTAAFVRDVLPSAVDPNSNPRLAPDSMSALRRKLTETAANIERAGNSGKPPSLEFFTLCASAMVDTADLIGSMLEFRSWATALVATLKRERDGYASHLRECEQIAGRTLGYPWYKDDQENFPGATEADGVCVGEHVGDTIVAELAGSHFLLREYLDHLGELDNYNAWEKSDAERRKQRVLAALGLQQEPPGER